MRLKSLLCIFGHKFLEWKYRDNELCDQVRTCMKCGFEQTRALHRFGEWEYISDKSCEQERTCTRCTAKQARKAPHNFGNWQDGERICSRCGKTEHCYRHDWEEISREESENAGMGYDEVGTWVDMIIVEKCRTCGKVKRTEGAVWDY